MYLNNIILSWPEDGRLTLTLLTWRIWWAPNNVSKWQMGFNSAFKGLRPKHVARYNPFVMKHLVLACVVYWRY